MLALCRRLRNGASRLALAAGFLASDIPAPRAQEPPLPAAVAPQMRGLPILQHRAVLASAPEPRAARASIVLVGARDRVEPAHLPTDLQNAYACLAGGSAAVAASLVAGTENLTNLIAGGVVIPQSQAVLYIGLVGVVFAAFCSISQSLLPIYTYHVTQPGHPQALPAAAGFAREAALPLAVAPDRVAFHGAVLDRRAPGAASPVQVAQER